MSKQIRKLITDKYIEFCQKRSEKEMNDIDHTLETFIEKCNFCILGTMDDDGYPVQRALLPPRKRNGYQEFFFSTNTSSNKVKQVRENAKCTLYFCDRNSFRGLCLRGTMELLQDKKIREMLWQKGDTIYYSKGIDDPDYSVLKFTALDGRYYANLSVKDINVKK